LLATGDYVSELKPKLPARAFEPALSRLLWLPLQLSAIGLGIAAIALNWLPTWLWPALSLIIGGAFAGLVFLGHETLHGAVIREKRARYLFGFVMFLPFAVSPRLWTAWHNRVHHGNANHAGVDPDAYPTLDEYRASRAVRIFTDWFGIGRGRLRGLVALSIGFSVQSLHVLLVAGSRGYLSPRQHRRALFETALGFVIWAGLLIWIGPLAFLFACFLPWLVANAIVMAYIFTNHALSPLTTVNDPLVNSLSVTVPSWVDALTLRFGFHVEHHLFPWMSSRHAPMVRDLILERWPERYQSLPLLRALLRVHCSPRVYLDATTLFDPGTGQACRALGCEGSRRPANDPDRHSLGPRAA
jgi:fatty acid desaturase